MNSLVRLFDLIGLTPKPAQAPCTDGYIRLPDDSPDMTALACSEFGLDPKTGFLPPQVPLARLPPLFDQWEDTLQHGMVVLKRPGDSDDPPPTEEEKIQSLKWREGVEQVRSIPISNTPTANHELDENIVR